MNTLLLHIPKFSSVYLPLGEFINITYMPMGLPAIGHQLNRAGHPTEILHLGVEWIADPDRNFVQMILDEDASLIGADLYWHYQTFDVLDVLTRVKEANPDAFVYLGGTTAGYFATQILEHFPAIDAVIRGDGEIAAVALADALENGLSLDRVPNLVYRADDGRIVSSTGIAVSQTSDIDDLVYGDLSILRNRDIYVQNFGFPLAYPKQFDHDRNRNTQRMGGRSFFPLFTGRGCPWECTFCGGNRKVLRELNNTPHLRFRSPKRVVDDIELAADHGYKTMSLCFDPTPQKDDYYVEVMQNIKKRKLDIDFYFECWGLPTRRFLDVWSDTFGADNPHSYLALSPDAGNEQVRKINKQPFYTDAEFYASMDMLEEFGITADIFFTIALPGETLKTALDTRDMIRRIQDEYTVQKRVMTWSVQLEPGSPQFERPEQFNMVTDRHDLMDFYRAHGGEAAADTYSSLGYRINDYFGDQRDHGTIAEFEAEIQSLKCMEFCFYGEDATKANDPSNGRQWCKNRRQEIADDRNLDISVTEISDKFRYADAARQLAEAFPATRPRW